MHVDSPSFYVWQVMEFEPDVLCLQEVDESLYSSFFVKHLVSCDFQQFSVSDIQRQGTSQLIQHNLFAGCGRPSFFRGRTSISVEAGSHRVLSGSCRRLVVCPGSVWRDRFQVRSGRGRIRVRSESRVQMCVGMVARVDQ